MVVQLGLFFFFFCPVGASIGGAMGGVLLGGVCGVAGGGLVGGVGGVCYDTKIERDGIKKEIEKESKKKEEEKKKKQ